MQTFNGLEIGDVFMMKSTGQVLFVKIDETSQVCRDSLIISTHDPRFGPITHYCERERWEKTVCVTQE